MHPAGSLYERPVNIDDAADQHDNFREILESYGELPNSFRFLTSSPKLLSFFHSSLSFFLSFLSLSLFSCFDSSSLTKASLCLM